MEQFFTALLSGGKTPAAKQALQFPVEGIHLFFGQFLLKREQNIHRDAQRTGNGGEQGHVRIGAFRLPFADSRRRDAHRPGQLFLRHMPFPAVPGNIFSDF